MHRFIFLFCCLMAARFGGYAAVSIPHIHGVNVITGHPENNPVCTQCQVYQPGICQTPEGTLVLDADDFRVGRVSAIDLESDSLYFYYEPQATKVFQEDRLTIYRFSISSLIENVEYYQHEKGRWELVRCDCFHWAEEGRLIGIVVEDGTGRTVKCVCLHYDGDERLVGREEQTEEAHVVSKRLYDAADNLTFESHQVSVEGISREYTIERQYDASQRPTSIVEGAQKTTRYVYNAEGQLAQIIKPDGVAIEYTYRDDRLLQEFKASDSTIDYLYEYDEFGRIASVHDRCRHSVQRLHYNASGILEEEQQSQNVKISYRYDEEGKLTGLSLPDGSQIAYRYTEELLTAIEKIGADGAVQYSHVCEYDAQGLLKSQHLPHGLGNIDYGYNSNRLAAVASPWWSQKVEFDASGKISSITAQERGEEKSFHFTYTDDGQLLKEKGHHYQCDSLYNRIGDNSQQWEVNSLNQLIQAPGAAYRYDANGNVVEKTSERGTTFFSYDALDRMIRVEIPQMSAWTSVYDSFGRKIEQREWEWTENEWVLKKTDRLVYDGFKDIGKLDSDGNLAELRVLGKGNGAEGGAAIAVELQGRLYVPIHDIQGSVRCLIDAETGKVAESYSFTAFGEESIWDEKGERLEQSVVGNPWRFCSKRTDEATGLVFFGKRDYDPCAGRWLTPDPLLFCDTPNLYAFARNDPLNCMDHYGLFSVGQFCDDLLSVFFHGFQYVQASVHLAKIRLGNELRLPDYVKNAFEKGAKTLVGESTYLLMGPHYEQTHISDYGEKEISDKVRITFINGILNTKMLIEENLALLSETHGGTKIHYVFRPTEGWTWDISRAIMIKTTHFFWSFRSLHAHLLAELWRSLIEEMGGVEGGGAIIHYAHSLGGSETDRARELLTPEEQKMIRVITFGSSTFIRNQGFQHVINHVSVNDGVTCFVLEPLGHIRNIFDPDSNVRYHAQYFGATPWWPKDHLLSGPTYGAIVQQLGEEFVAEYGESNLFLHETE